MTDIVQLAIAIAQVNTMTDIVQLAIAIAQVNTMTDSVASYSYSSS